MKTLRLHQVLIASPSDTAEERTVAGEVVEEINQVWVPWRGILLKSLMWETDTYAATGEDGQAVINDQIGDDYDAFVGIMRERFGSPTLHHESGTKEEYLRAYARHQQDPESVDIGFYFSSAPISREHLTQQAWEQVQKVLAFKEEVARSGTLYKEYSSMDELRIHIQHHLSRLMQKWADRSGSASQLSPGIENHDVLTVQRVNMTFPPLSEETAAHEMNLAGEYLGRANKGRKQIVEAITKFGQQTQARTHSFQKAMAAKDPAAIMHVQGKGHAVEARELAELGDTIAPLVIPFGQNNWSALLTLSRVAAFTAARKTDLDGARRVADVQAESRSQFENFRMH